MESSYSFIISFTEQLLIAYSRHTILAALPSTRPDVKPPPSLLTIPGEIRNRIYELLLIFESVDAYNCAPCCVACPPREEIPYVPILRVNRQTNKEASALLYSTSTFIISTGRDLIRFMSKPEDYCLYTPATETFPTRAAIRSLELRFVADYIPTIYHEERMRELWQNQGFGEQSRKQRAKHLHDLDRNSSQAVWLVAGELLRMLDGLKVLTINLEQAFCPEGCCRLVKDVVRSLRKFRHKSGLEIKVKGNLDDSEVEVVTSGLKFREAENDSNEDDGTESDDSSDDGSSDDSDDSDGSDGSGDGSTEEEAEDDSEQLDDSDEEGKEDEDEGKGKGEGEGEGERKEKEKEEGKEHGTVPGSTQGPAGVSGSLEDFSMDVSSGP